MAVKEKKNKITPRSKVDTTVENLFGTDKDAIEDALFFASWLEEGRDNTKAYLKIHPEVTYGSARVLGSKALARINREVILQAYNLDINRYLTKIDQGLEAKKTDHTTGEKIPDRQTEIYYHGELKDVLGLKKAETNIQVNIIPIVPVEAN